MKNTEILTTNINDIKKAADIIKSGGTVVFPTETVYGLGANALSEDAVQNIFIAKGRPSDNPLIVHIDNFDKIDRYVKKITENAKKLADAYWPGPMTLILEKEDCISDVVSAGLKTVGIRVPKSETAREFLQYSDLPVAAPSANVSGSPSPTTFEHVMKDMLGRVDAIINGENSEVGLESTVIDVTGDIPEILRPGAITPDMVKAVCGEVKINSGINGVETSEKPKSPGMKYRHYAPKCKIVLIEACTDIVNKIKENINDDKTVVLCSKQIINEFSTYNTICIGDRKNPETIAHNLFDVFRMCDEKGYKTAILEGVDDEGIGLAIMNRARRAAK